MRMDALTRACFNEKLVRYAHDQPGHEHCDANNHSNFHQIHFNVQPFMQRVFPKEP